MDNAQIANGNGEPTQQQIDSEQAFNDAQMASLAEVKKRRKAIEHDANLLANRIALLKQEEMKTWKKIDDTRKRTTEIISLKNRNEDRIKQKEREFHEKQEMERYQSTQNYMIQKQRAEEKRKVQKAIYLSKTEEAKQAKIVKVQNEQLIRHQEFKVETENKMKNQIVNQQKRLAQMKMEEEQRRKISNAQRNQQEKTVIEEIVRQQKEDEVLNMERIEMELIKKLQNTQAIQKEAYQELERALKEPCVAYNKLKASVITGENN